MSADTPSEFEALAAAYFIGDIGNEELARLKTMLRQEPQARKHFVAMALQEIALRQVLCAGAGQRASGVTPAVTRPRRGRLNLWPWAIAASVLLAAGLLWRLTQAPQSDEKLAVRIAAVAPGSTLERRGKQMSATAEMELYSGDVIVSPQEKSGGGLRLAWPGEKTEIALDGNTRLVLLEEKAGKQFELKKGAVTAGVDKQPAGAPMTFLTPDARAEVKGTKLRLCVPGSQSLSGTRLDVEEGVVRLVRLSDRKAIEVAANQYAVVSQGVELAARNKQPEAAVAPPVTVWGPWKDLFNGRNLDGWEIMKDHWAVEHNEIVGEGWRKPNSVGAHLDSADLYLNFEFECKVCAERKSRAEIQILDRGFVYSFELSDAGVWHQLKVAVNGARAEANLDGSPLQFDPADSTQKFSKGSISLYVSQESKVRFRELRVRELSNNR